MLIAIENIDLYRYEIHSLIKAFFPEEDVKVRLSEKPSQQAEAGKSGHHRNDPDPCLIFDFENDRILIHLIPTQMPGIENGMDAVNETGAINRAGTINGTVSENKTDPDYATDSDNGSDPEILRRIEAPAGIVLNEKSKDCKNLLKKELYRLLSEYTGQTLPWGELIGIRPTKIAMQQLLQGKTQEEAALYMEKEHLCSPEKAELAADIAARERRILSKVHYENGYSLYIGIPFCPTTCLYCSFTSFSISAWKDRVDEYLRTLKREMEAVSELMKGRNLDAVYIGGGTPTTPEPAQLEFLMEALEEYFPMDSLLEFTVEAGRADSITKEKLKVLKRHGVSRISVNPQTMNDRTLELIGRRHTVDQVREAFHLARESGFDNINMDIILGLPGENEEDVRYTISEIEKLGPDSLTVHSLALKRASRMQKWIEKNGFSSIHNTDDMMKIAAEGAARMDMKPYYLYRQKNMSGNFENVGYAREGRAGIYNILIMEEKQSILALGAGSISKGVFDNGRIERSDNCKDVATYIDHIDEMIGRKQKLFLPAIS